MSRYPPIEIVLLVIGMVIVLISYISYYEYMDVAMWIMGVIASYSLCSVFNREFFK